VQYATRAVQYVLAAVQYARNRDVIEEKIQRIFNKLWNLEEDFQLMEILIWEKKACGKDIETDCAVCGCASQDFRILGINVVHKLQYAGLSYAVIQYGVHRNSREK
jgi:hypothetical protein